MRHLWIVPAIIFLVFTIPLLDGSYWFDELFSVEQAKSFDEILVDVHPPLYQVLLAGWIRIFSDTEIATRSLSLIAGLLAVIILSRYNLTAGALLSLSPVVHEIATTTRSYALLLLLATITTILVLEKDRRLIWASIPLALTHYYGTLTAFGAHLADIINRRRSAILPALIWSGIVGSWIVFHVFFVDFTRGGWIPSVEPLTVLSGLFGYQIGWLGILAPLLLIGAPLSLVIIIASTTIPGFLASIMRPSIVIHYVVAAIPAMLLIVALRTPKRLVPIILIAAAILVPFSEPLFIEQDYRAAAELIATSENPIVISLESQQGHYTGGSIVCEHPLCIEAHLEREHTHVWLINGAFADFERYTPALEGYTETIHFFEGLEVREYTR